jgi:hypothetical protein
MQMELGYFDHETGVQKQCSIQGYAVNGLMIFVSNEAIEPDTYLTVRTPTSTLVERIDLNKMHQISDFQGGNGNDDSGQGIIYVDLGLVSLGDAEEMHVILDCESAEPGLIKMGVSAIIDELPEHDELIYHYQHHTDTSFNSDSAAACFLFKSSIGTNGSLINAKMGEDTRSTTLRSTNWFANLMGKIELDNLGMGVLFDNKYGQPLTINMAETGVTTIVKRIVQVDSVRRVQATKRLARTVATKFGSLDAQTKRAIP